MLTTLSQALAFAKEKQIALGHFNVSTLDAVHAIIQGAKSLDLPVVIGVSEGERDFIGIQTLSAVIATLRAETGQPIFLNADHTYTLDRVKEVVAAGYDSVIFDGAGLSASENIVKAKAVVDYVKSVRPEMLVEAEIGYIGKSSALLDAIPDHAAITEDQMPTASEVNDFVSKTGVDLIAPAVGNIHGMLKNAPNPNLSISRIREIVAATPAPFVLHGGSGISDDQFRQSIKAGVRMIHINTEIRRAWRDGLAGALTHDPNEVAPYKLLQPAQTALKEVVVNRLRLFSNL